MRVTSRLLPVIALLLCALLLLGKPPARAAQPEPSAWTLIDLHLPQLNMLTSVFMVDGPDGAWVTTNGSAVLRLARRNGAWTVQERAEFHGFALNAVVAPSETNVWAVGAEGMMVHKDATGWHTVPNPVWGADLYTIQMFGSGEEGWAAGSLPPDFSSDFKRHAVLLHYQHGTWSRDPAISDEGVTINSLHFGAGGGWAVGQVMVGESAAPVAWRYTGDTWQRENFPACTFCAPPLLAVRSLGRSEAWAVGLRRAGFMGIEPSVPVAFQRTVTGWHDVLSNQPVVGDTDPNRYAAGLDALSFSPDGFGLAVGHQQHQDRGAVLPYILSYRPDGRWHYEAVPAFSPGYLTGVSQADSTHALAVGVEGLVLAYGYPAAPTPQPTATPTTARPTDRVADPRQPGVVYYPQTGHTLRGRFQVYWTGHGGLPQFGYPLTEEFAEVSPTDGRTYTVEYFERARFEYHPEYGPGADVLLGLLGQTITAGRQDEPAFRPQPGPAPAGRWFPETAHTLAPEFLGYWTGHGGLPVYGYPISEAMLETSPTDGKAYQVQYFERNRLEYHPELPEPYRVSLGLLGVQVLQMRGWLP